MTEPNRDVPEGTKIDVVALLKTHGRISILVAAGVAVLVGVAGFVYMRWIQPVTRQAAIEFRPTFIAADRMEYPNGLPFSPSDVTAASVIDHVWATAGVKPYCAAEPFRAGFFVEQRSDESMWLDMEYRALLGQPRLDPVERRQLQDEHAAKRRALPLQYRLVFSMPSECGSIPNTVVSQAMSIVLPTWATESETKRGVLKYQLTVLGPTTLDVTSEGPGGWVLGADLLRTALERIILNVEEVAKIPGAVQVRLSTAPVAAGTGTGGVADTDRLTFWELRGKLDDLLRAQLEPLVMTSGKSLARESFVWINETVASAEREQKTAENRAKKYQEGLQQFSGTAIPIDARVAAAPSGPNSAGAQTLMPQFDQSFIDRIIQMSGINAGFRQGLTEQMVTANLEAVRAQNRADYYRRLLQSLRESGGISTSPEELSRRLEEIKTEGKKLTKQFGDLYDEFSRVALRPAAGLYQSEKPVTFEENKSFSRRSLMQVVAGGFMAVLVLMFGFLVIRERLILERS